MLGIFIIMVFLRISKRVLRLTLNQFHLLFMVLIQIEAEQINQIHIKIQ